MAKGSVDGGAGCTAGGQRCRLRRAQDRPPPPGQPLRAVNMEAQRQSSVRMARTFRNADIFRGVPEKPLRGGGRKQGEIRRKCVKVPS